MRYKRRNPSSYESLREMDREHAALRERLRTARDELKAMNAFDTKDPRFQALLPEAALNWPVPELRRAVESAEADVKFYADFWKSAQDYQTKKGERSNPMNNQTGRKVFRWSTPAPNWDGSIPKPWRVADASTLREILAKHGYPNAIAYVEHEGAHNLFVGLRDNRNAAQHDKGMRALAALLRRLKIGNVTMATAPAGWRQSYAGILLLDPMVGGKKTTKSYRKKNPRGSRYK